MRAFFDNYILDTEIPALLQEDREIALEPKVFDLLVLLVEQRGRAVTKDEIIEHLWRGRLTSDTAISTCVKTLRRALDDDGAQQRLIRTQRGRGFRFVGDVRVDDGSSVSPSVVISELSESPPQEKAVVGRADSLPRDGKPSIIVLPFRSQSGAGDQIVADAISHDIIQSLAKLRWIRVIARGTAFQFRMNEPDLLSIGQQLDVRYVLSGAQEKIGSRHSIAVELSDCQTADVVWAERFEISPEQLQETWQKIVAEVISSLEIHIPMHEAHLAGVKSSENLDAWANYHLGLRHVFRFTNTDNQKASGYFRRAIKQDGQFSRAYAGLSFARFQDAFLKYDSDTDSAVRDAREMAEKGIAIDSLDPFTNFTMGRSYWLENDMAGGHAWLERSIALSPNFAQGFYSCAFSEMVQGDPSLSVQYSETANHLSPLDPLLYAIYSARGIAYLRLGEMAQAVDWAEQGARAPGAHYLIFMIAAAINALAGNQDRADHWRRAVIRSGQKGEIAHFLVAFPFADAGVRDMMVKGLKSAGF